MFTVTAIVSILLAAMLTLSAIRKLSHREDVVETYVRVGVPADRLDHLAIILLAGAAGVIAGLFWAPIGVAAGIGLVVYFLLAIAAHIRADDEEHIAPPLVLEVAAAGALALRLATI